MIHDRRSVVATISAALMACAAQAVPAWRPARDAGWSPADLSSSTASAVKIGRAYLALRPEERDRARLTQSLTASGRITHSRAFARHFEQLRAADFAHGRIVVLDGWVLAESEVRLCALLTLA